MSNLTKEQAIALAESGWWRGLPADAIASFQLFEEKLCMDFADFHAAVETALGRPVFTHEFGLDIDGLKHEFLGDRPTPTFTDILALIPEDKRVIVLEVAP
jgi:hypothetical protein